MSEEAVSGSESAEVQQFPQWSRMEQVDSMSAEELDDLPFGAIRLNEEGIVVSYNAAEAEISGRDPEQVIGKNFFEEVAPCTNVREFAGRFREGVRHGDLNAIFPYMFDFEMQPTRVWVRLFYSSSSGTAWVFVTRRDDE